MSRTPSLRCAARAPGSQSSPIPAAYPGLDAHITEHQGIRDSLDAADRSNAFGPESPRGNEMMQLLRLKSMVAAPADKLATHLELVLLNYLHRVLTSGYHMRLRNQKPQGLFPSLSTKQFSIPF